MQWDGKDINQAILHDIQRFVRITINDSIQTLGVSGIFPSGIHVGVVSSYKTIEETNTLDINVALSSDIQKVKNVYILENRFIKEINTLEEEIK